MKQAHWLRAVVLGCMMVLAASGGCRKSTPSGVTIKQGTPEELIATDFAIRENWDNEGMVQIMHPDHQYAARLLLSLAEKPQKLKNAVCDLAVAVEGAYGKEMADRIWQGIGKYSPPDLRQDFKKEIKDVYADGKVDWEKVKVYAQDDKGRVVWPGQKSPTQIAKVGDKWYELFDEASPQSMEPQIRMQIDALDDCIGKLNKITANVKAGDLSKERFEVQMKDLGLQMVRLGQTAGLGAPSPAQPEKPKIASVPAALTALKSSDVFVRNDGLVWLRQAKVTRPSEREAVLAAVVEQRESGKEDLTDLFCQYAQEKQIPELIKLAESRESGQWQPSLTALFRLSPQEGRTVVKHRATEWPVRAFAENLFRKNADRYSDEASLLLDSPNPDLQRDMVNVLADIGGEPSMPHLRQFKSRLADQPQQAGLIRDADRALQTIRQRVIDHGKPLPPEPTTPLPTISAPVVSTPTPKPKLADLDAALAALKTRNGFEQREALDWIDHATIVQTEDIQKVAATANEARKTEGMNTMRIAALFLRYAGDKYLDDIESMTRERNNALWVPAFRKLYRLSPNKAHAVVLARGSDFFFRIDLFKEFIAGGAIYEDELILCLQSTDNGIRNEAVKTLGEVGTSKSIVPLSGLKNRTNLKKESQVVEQIDQAIKAIQLRGKATSKSAPGK